MSVYVYGITTAGQDLTGLAGIGDAPVRVIAHESLAAAVSDAGEGPLRASAAGLKAHTRVLEEIAALTTVLPLRFGTVLESDAAVAEAVLASHERRLTRLLERLEGHVQLTVRAVMDESAALTDIIRSDARVGAARRKVKGIPPAAAYYDRITLGQEIARALRERSAAAGARLFEALAPLSIDAVTKDPSQELMVLDADFLVDATKVEDFDSAVERLAQERPELQFRYLGPMPAYSFADLELQEA